MDTRDKSAKSIMDKFRKLFKTSRWEND
jgi:hypothetical protein